MSGLVDAQTLVPRTPPEVVLEDIVRTIVERVHPRRIILIGSRARGDARPDSDYDVVVEMDTDDKAGDSWWHQIYGFFPDRDWALNVIPRATGAIERAADDPGTMDWDIVRQGIVLHAADGVGKVLTVPPVRYVRERPEVIPPSAHEWVVRARADLEQAQLSANMGRGWPYVCFFSQQSAEKYFKALLVRVSTRPEWIHDLEKLLKKAKAAGAQLPGLDEDCALLTPYAATTRYGDYASFDEPKGRTALAAAERIAAAIEPLLI